MMAIDRELYALRTGNNTNKKYFIFFFNRINSDSLLMALVRMKHEQLREPIHLYCFPKLILGTVIANSLLVRLPLMHMHKTHDCIHAERKENK
jgi:hypothetical protein